MRRVKREIVGGVSNGGRETRSGRIVADDDVGNRRNDDVEGVGDHVEDEVVVRRNLRSRYLHLKNLLSGDGGDLTDADLDKFKSVINEVEDLHQKVQKPREQVADAEAFLDITSSFVKVVKAHKNDGLTPSDFVTCLLSNFGQQGRGSSVDGARNVILWKDIGLAVSHVFRKGAGCCTMLGPMSAEMKKRKSVVRKKHVKPTETARPEELNNTVVEKTDTDKNMATMFGVLRKNRKVRLENLVLNRSSFAQTVENLFALSFLVKDGRVEIIANESGHFVCPRNAPAAESVTTGKVSYSHFVFRLDFKDWKLMLDSVEEGTELMPHRIPVDTYANSYQTGQGETVPDSPPRVQPQRSSSNTTDNHEQESTAATTPIRKLCRNRGLVMQEQTVVEDSPERDDSNAKAAYIRKGKRKICKM